MSSYIFCASYQELQCNFCIRGGMIGIELKSSNGKDRLYFALNPMQAKTFAEHLQNTALRIPVNTITNAVILGDLEVQWDLEKTKKTEKRHGQEIPVA